MAYQKQLNQQRRRRALRVRRRVRANPHRPRLTVFRSHKHIYAQVIDDLQGRTLAAASTMDQELRPSIGYGGNKQAATLVGQALARRALAAGVKQVAFDRGRYKFHGRVAALAAAAREAGLEF
jgi:large subunit ribosomal protein L18